MNFRNNFNWILKRTCLVIYKNNYIISFLPFIFLINIIHNLNLKFILNYFQLNVLYKIDNLYFYDDFSKEKQLTINPILMNFYLINDINDELKFNIIKKYNPSVPLFVFFYNENININDFLKIKSEIFHLNRLITNTFLIKDVKYKLIKEIL